MAGSMRPGRSTSIRSRCSDRTFVSMPVLRGSCDDERHPRHPRRGAHDDDRATDPATRTTNRPPTRPSPGPATRKATAPRATPTTPTSRLDRLRLRRPVDRLRRRRQQRDRDPRDAPRSGRRPGRARQPDRPRVLGACRRTGRDRRRQGRAPRQASGRGDLRGEWQARREVALVGLRPARVGRRGTTPTRRRHGTDTSVDPHAAAGSDARQRTRPTRPTRPDRAASILRP